jgi:hypothetical protein
MTEAELQDLSTRFAEAYQLSPEDEADILRRLDEDSTLQNLGISSASVNERQNTNSESSVPVDITQVSTLVCRGQKMEGASYIVPSWARHWGVIIDEVLWHLRYDPKKRAVMFTYRPWEQEDERKYTVRQVGTTRYTWKQIRALGSCVF